MKKLLLKSKRYGDIVKQRLGIEVMSVGLYNIGMVSMN